MEDDAWKKTAFDGSQTLMEFYMWPYEASFTRIFQLYFMNQLISLNELFTSQNAGTPKTSYLSKPLNTDFLVHETLALQELDEDPNQQIISIQIIL